MERQEQLDRLAMNLGRVKGIDWEEARGMISFADSCGAVERLSMEIEERNITDRNEIWKLISGFLREQEEKEAAKA